MISLHPNPTTGTVRLRYELPVGTISATVQLQDALGRTVQQVPLSSPRGEYTLPLQLLPSGLYFYRLSTGTQMLQTGKLVKLE